MIFVQLIEVGEKYKAGLKHYRPEQLPEDVLETGVLIESLPFKDEIPGKQAILYATKPDKELYYEYEIAPETEVTQLRNDLNEAVMELSLLIAMRGTE